MEEIHQTTALEHNEEIHQTTALEHNEEIHQTTALTLLIAELPDESLKLV